MSFLTKLKDWWNKITKKVDTEQDWSTYKEKSNHPEALLKLREHHQLFDVEIVKEGGYFTFKLFEDDKNTYQFNIQNNCLFKNGFLLVLAHHGGDDPLLLSIIEKEKEYHDQAKWLEEMKDKLIKIGFVVENEEDNKLIVTSDSIDRFLIQLHSHSHMTITHTLKALEPSSDVVVQDIWNIDEILAKLVDACVLSRRKTTARDILAKYPDFNHLIVIGKKSGAYCITPEDYLNEVGVVPGIGYVFKDLGYIILSAELDKGVPKSARAIDEELFGILFSIPLRSLQSLRDSQILVEDSEYVKDLAEYINYEQNPNKRVIKYWKDHMSSINSIVGKQYNPDLLSFDKSVTEENVAERYEWVLKVFDRDSCHNNPKLLRHQITTFNLSTVPAMDWTDRNVISLVLTNWFKTMEEEVTPDSMRSACVSLLTKYSKHLSRNVVLDICKLFSDKTSTVAIMETDKISFVDQSGEVKVIPEVNKPKGIQSHVSTTPTFSKYSANNVTIPELETQNNTYCLYTGTQAFVDKDSHQMLFEYWMNRALKESGKRQVFLKVIDAPEGLPTLYTIISKGDMLYLVNRDSLPEIRKTPSKSTKRGKRK